MKRSRIVLAGTLILAAAVFFLWSRRTPENPSAPASPRAPVRAPQPFERPVSEKEPLAGPRPIPSSADRAPVQPPAPLKVAFSPMGKGKLKEPIPLDVVVEGRPESWPAGLSGEVTLEFLIRIPAGLQLKSEGWTPVELPPEEKKQDPAGLWSLFERKRPLTLPAGTPTGEITRERVELAVVTPGTNWIVTTRVRLSRDSRSWQTFAVIFATVGKDGETEFHPAPRMPAMEQRAQADRS